MANPISSDIQNNLNKLPSFINSITNAFIVRTTGSPSIIGVSGFVFDIVGAEDFSLDSNITDHYTEDNVSIQDQIALAPEQFTLTGYVGELVQSFPNLFTDILTVLQDFTIVSGISPKFSNQATRTYNQIAQIASGVKKTINEATNLFSLFTGLNTTANKQQTAFQYFYKLWLGKQLCEVETPWGIFKDMAILNVKARQDEETRIVSSFSVTFKKMRFANTLVTTTSGVELSALVGRALQVLKKTPDNSGSTNGTVTNNSVLNQNASLLTYI